MPVWIPAGPSSANYVARFSSLDGILRTTKGGQTSVAESHREREVRVADAIRGGFVVRPGTRRELPRGPSLANRIRRSGHCVDKRGNG